VWQHFKLGLRWKLPKDLDELGLAEKAATERREEREEKRDREA
jgi:hypothetical protein